MLGRGCGRGAVRPAGRDALAARGVVAPAAGGCRRGGSRARRGGHPVARALAPPTSARRASSGHGGAVHRGCRRAAGRRHAGGRAPARGDRRSRVCATKLPGWPASAATSAPRSSPLRCAAAQAGWPGSRPCGRSRSEAGAGLADGCERIADWLRDDEALRREVAAQLAGARASARLLAGLARGRDRCWARAWAPVRSMCCSERRTACAASSSGLLLGSARPVVDRTPRARRGGPGVTPAARPSARRLSPRWRWPPRSSCSPRPIPVRRRLARPHRRSIEQR